MKRYHSIWSSLVILMHIQPIYTFGNIRLFAPRNLNHPATITRRIESSPDLSAAHDERNIRVCKYHSIHNFQWCTISTGIILRSKEMDGDEQSMAPVKSSRMKYNDYKEQLEALSFLSIMGDDDTLSQNDDEDDNGTSYLSQKAQRIFDEMYETWVSNGDEYEDLEPTTDIYNLLIDVYAHAQSTAHGIEIADSILQKMEDATRSDSDVEFPSPDIDTYFSVMSGWAKQNISDKVHSTFQRLKRYHHSLVTTSTTKAPHAESYNTLLYALEQSNIPSAAMLSEALLREMIGTHDETKRSDGETDVNASGNIVEVPSNTITKDELQKLTVKRLKEMISEMNISTKSSNLRLKADIIDFIVQHQNTTEKKAKTIPLIDDKGTDIPEPNTRTFYLVLSCILRHQATPSPHMNDDILHHGVQEKVQEIVDLMTDFKTRRPNTEVNPQHTSITNARIKALGQKGNKRSKGLAAAEEAESLLLDAIALYKREGDINTRPDAASFINAINVWRGYRPSGKQNDRAARRAMDLLHAIEDFYSEEKSKTYKVEGSGGGDSGSNKSLDKLKPDYRVYNAVQYIWARSRSKHRAKETRSLLDKMILLQEETGDHDYSPNKRSYNNVINACTFFTKCSNDSEENKEALRIAVQTFNDMRASAEVEPDHVTYGMLLRAVGELMTERHPSREKVIENIFRKCCKDGHVSDFVLESFTAVSDESFYEKIIGTRKYNDSADSIYIPFEWSKNVPTLGKQ